MNFLSTNFLNGRRFLAAWLLKTINRALSPFGLVFSRIPLPWVTSKDFEPLYDKLNSRTVNSRDRVFIVYQWVCEAARRDGDIAEVGVFQGGISRLLACTCPGKTIHLFDTFDGIPENKIEAATESQWSGKFKHTSLNDVKAYLKDLDNVSFHSGIFPETAAAVADRRFCFVHLDADLFESIMAGLVFFYPRMVSGGVIIVDDYRWELCPGVERAFVEFMADKPERIIQTVAAQALLIKD